ncbi:MAG: enoyl-CoA hydratase/isomerase family protein, partial [Pseudomonadota bacterium]
MPLEHPLTGAPDMLTVTKDAFVQTVTINRPEVKNAVNPAVADGLIDTLRAAGEDPEVKVMILTGAGSIFTAGVDLGCLLKRNEPDNHRMLYERLPIMVAEFIKFPKPLIIAVNGIGIGFGATVAGIGDVTVMDETAKLRTPFTSLGVVPEVAAT